MPRRVVGTCQKCGIELPVWELSKCPICGKNVCRRCATFAYGRYFCSNPCAQYFFHAEGEDEGDEPENP